MIDFEITFYPVGKKATLNRSVTILEAAKSIGIDISGPCGGQGKCGKCAVRIIHYPRDIYIPPDPVSKEKLGDVELRKGYRLACTFRVTDNFGIELPSWAYEHSFKIGVDSSSRAILERGWIHPDIEKKYGLNPGIQVVHCSLLKPTLDDNIGDFERLLRCLNSKTGFSGVFKEGKLVSDNLGTSNDLLKRIANVIRDNDWQISPIVARSPNGMELLDVQPQKESDVGANSKISSDCYGLAVDIGTSTIVVYLIDLVTGNQISVGSAVNPQIRIGADVITRIRYTTQTKNGDKQLQALLIGTINQLIAKICSHVNVNADNIYELSVVGNTTMIQSFLGIPLGALGTAPYSKVFDGNCYFDASTLSLDINPAGKVYVGPIVSGFLGADAVGTALVANMLPVNGTDNRNANTNNNVNDNVNNEVNDGESVKLVIDIGTNGEILLSDNNRLLACSTAAGPAFEGSNLRFGMRAMDGVVYSVKIKKNRIDYRSIGNKRPIGISGSGVVDAIFEFMSIGAIKKNGTINPKIDHKLLRLQKKQRVRSATEPTTNCDLILPELLVVPKQNSGLKTSITITQDDVREVQLAKAAIRTGIDLLLDELGFKIADIDMVYLAGAFGNYLNPRSAVGIKLLPEIPLNKIRSIGTSAGTSAVLLLRSIEARERIKQIAKAIDYIDLAAHKGFQDRFIKNMEF
jgi:uncharacterized 2Fe-2S/4Fe-4S cluster protein (DUF4445 family)